MNAWLAAIERTDRCTGTGAATSPAVATASHEHSGRT